ncbi:Disks large-associated protein 1 [Fasciola hepatica]|uniref:Disks large-associated protein 1 n=1 Tax=Fasciola hepatica TaxID=6192 RepID=A0A4E0RQJ0_FASHE|nr:Disks large-associated protein 1 [Fasciola hepatica]
MDVHQNLLQSEVLSFFSPITTDVNSLVDYPVAPKCDIFEPAAPKSKTITVKCEDLEDPKIPHLNNTPDGHTDVNGVYRLERLDSSVNPDITAKLDRMAQKLGFQVPAKSSCTNHSSSDCEDLQLDEVDFADVQMSKEPDSFRNGTSSPAKPHQTSAPKRSLFTSLMKRLSSRPKHTSPSIRSKSEDSHQNRPRVTTVDSGPSGIRRWLSKRFWRQKNVERKEIEPSETSMASAGAVLEGSFNLSSADHLNSPASHTHVKHAAIPDCQSSHSGPRREFLSLEQLSPLGSAPHGHTQTEVVAYKHHPTCPVPTTSHTSAVQAKAHTLNYSSSAEATSFCRPVAVSFSQNSLLEDRNTRTSGVTGSVPFNSGSFLSREVCGSEGTALHRTHRAPAQAISMLPSGYTPSYVSVSVAAFGYSNYGRTSLSSGSLHNSRSEKLKGLPIPGQCVPTSSSHNGVLPAAGKLAKDLSEIQPALCRISRSELQKNPLRVNVKESTDEDFRPNGTVENGLVESELNEKHLLGDKSVESPRLPRPISQSPCPSPAGDMCDSAPGTVRLRRTRTRSQTGNSDDQEHWHRSSLIMLAVAHASPRGRMATSIVTPDSNLILHHGDGEDATSGSVLGDAGYTSLTHSYRESIMEEPNEDSKTPSPAPCTQKRSSPENITLEPSDTIDGNYFLRLTEQVQAEILVQIEQTEADLKSVFLENEEVAGLMRTAVGKAKLLLSEKFVQFRSLCQQNLDWLSTQQTDARPGQITKTDGPDLVTLASDLDGFWAMVMLQVDDVRALFEKVDQLRKNDWQVACESDQTDGSIAANGVGPGGDGETAEWNKTPLSKPTVRKQNTGTKSASRGRDDSAARAKARERLAMAKREIRAKQMELKTANKTSDDDGFIIV